MIAEAGSILAAGASGGILGLITNGLRLIFQWKKEKAELDASTEAMRHQKNLEIIEAENEFTRPRIKKSSITRNIIWRDKKYGYERKKTLDNSSYNHLADSRRMLTHYLTLTFCAVCILWSIYPETLIHTKDYGENPEPFSFLFGLVTMPIKPHSVIQVSTGSVSFGLLHLMSFIAAFFYTQIRR